jgi:hypothetical protein
MLIGANAMARTTELQCRNCGFRTKTTDNIPAGQSIGCPRCRLPIEIMRPADANEEAREAQFTDDLEPILSTRASRIAGARKRALVSNRPPPFHQSRSFIAALSVTVIVLVVLVLGILYRDTIGLLSRGMKVAEKNRVKKFTAPDLARRPSKSDQNVPSSPIIANSDSKPGAKATKEDEGPVVAPAETKVGDLVVNVSSAMLAKVAHDSADQCLLLKIRIRNESKKPVTFLSWSQPQIRVVLVDSRGKQYNRLQPLVPDPAVIEPGQAVDDSVAFEETPLHDDLLLELEVYGRQTPIRFRILGSRIVRSMGAAFASAPGQQPAVAAAAAPPQAPRVGMGQGLREPVQEESPFSAEVNAAYNEGINRARKRALGKGSNEAAIFMRREKAELVRSLAKKHSVTADQIRQALVDP